MKKPKPPAVNPYGLDAAYFGKILKRTLRDIQNYDPGGLARALVRMALTASSSATACELGRVDDDRLSAQKGVSTGLQKQLDFLLAENAQLKESTNRLDDMLSRAIAERNNSEQSMCEFRAENERMKEREQWIHDNSRTVGGGHGFTVTFFVPVDHEDIFCGISEAIKLEQQPVQPSCDLLDEVVEHRARAVRRVPIEENEMAQVNAPIIIYRHLGDTTYYAEVIAVGTNGKGILLESTDNNDKDDRKQFGDCYKIAKSMAKRYAKFWGCESVGQHEKDYAGRTKHFKDKWEP